MQWLLVLSTLIGLYILSSLWSLLTRFLAARQSGFPTYVCPTNPANPLWMVLQVPLRPIFAKVLPAPLFERIKVTMYGWEFGDRFATHAKLGSTFLYVTPGTTELWTADEEIGNTILSRRNDFIMPPIVSAIMNVFGPNLLMSNGEDWQRQRKLVAPNLNERIMDLVWAESSKQALEMVEHYASAFGGETDEAVEGLRTIAMNVLGSAGYGVSQPWKQEPDNTDSGYKLTYVDAVCAIINNIIAVAVIPSRFFSLPIMPDTVRRIGTALQEFPIRTKDMLQTERRSAASDASPRNNMMSTLVRLSDTAKHDEGVDSKSAQHLSEEEILGNLFLFTIAGFDTTANSLAYAVALLATESRWQNWIIEEIDLVLNSEQSNDYAKLFPKLPRCLAFMYEILRFYPPILHITRSTLSPQIVTAGSKTYEIPANTLIYINTSAVATNPRTWGPDAAAFLPTRWLSPDPTSEASSLIAMPRGTFVPWSAGPRVCPGQKMAQVEFVAVIMTIFRRYTVAPVVEKGETLEDAQERLRGCMRDSQPRLTLRMNKPRDVNLKWTRR